MVQELQLRLRRPPLGAARQPATHSLERRCMSFIDTDVSVYVLTPNRYANARYKSQVQAEYNALISEGNTALAAKVAKLTTVPVGIWIADRASVPNIGTHLQDASNIQSSTGKKQSKF